jgi:hypothetical protein
MDELLPNGDTIANNILTKKQQTMSAGSLTSQIEENNNERGQPALRN